MNIKVASLVAVIAVTVGLIFLFLRQDIAVSPEQIYPAHEGPGTGHAFGYNIPYTVERHAIYDGKEMVVISSGALGEGHVEIWSPIPDLVALSDGSAFQLSKAESWSEAFEILKRGS